MIVPLFAFYPLCNPTNSTVTFKQNRSAEKPKWRLPASAISNCHSQVIVQPGLVPGRRLDAVPHDSPEAQGIINRFSPSAPAAAEIERYGSLLSGRVLVGLDHTAIFIALPSRLARPLSAI